MTKVVDAVSVANSEDLGPKTVIYYSDGSVQIIELPTWLLELCEGFQIGAASGGMDKEDIDEAVSQCRWCYCRGLLDYGSGYVPAPIVPLLPADVPSVV